MVSDRRIGSREQYLGSSNMWRYASSAYVNCIITNAAKGFRCRPEIDCRAVRARIIFAF